MRRIPVLLGLLGGLVASPALAQVSCGAFAEGLSGTTYVSIGAVGRGDWSLRADAVTLTVKQNASAGRYTPEGKVWIGAKVRLPERPAVETVRTRITLDNGQTATMGEATRTLVRDGASEFWTYGAVGAYGSWVMDAEFHSSDVAMSKTVTVTLEFGDKVIAGPWIVPVNLADRESQLARGWKAAETMQMEGGCALPRISAPEWIRRPSRDVVQKLYPAKARRAGKSGQAVLSCTVTATGTLEKCAVSSDTDGLFGEAALKMVKMYQMKPVTRDGTPVTGGQVRIPIRFAPQD